MEKGLGRRLTRGSISKSTMFPVLNSDRTSLLQIFHELAEARKVFSFQVNKLCPPCTAAGPPHSSLVNSYWAISIRNKHAQFQRGSRRNSDVTGNPASPEGQIHQLPLPLYLLAGKRTPEFHQNAEVFASLHSCPWRGSADPFRLTQPFPLRQPRPSRSRS